MALSSHNDYRLGLNLVHAIASEDYSQIRSEEGDVLSTAEFLSQFDDNWVCKMMQSAEAMFKMIARNGGTVIVHGAMRPFTLGRLMLQKLCFIEDPMNFSERFFIAMRHSQWDLSACYEASAITLKRKDSTTRRTTSIFGASGLTYLIAKVDFLAIQIDGEMIFIPWSQAANAFGSRLSYTRGTRINRTHRRK